MQRLTNLIILLAGCAAAGLASFTFVEVVPANAQETEELRRSILPWIDGNYTYTDSEGVTYRHQPLYDPKLGMDFDLRGNDGSTLRCSRDVTTFTCVKKDDWY